VTFNFNAKTGLIHTRARIVGPNGAALFVLALDTGANSTLINVSRLAQLGYDPVAIGQPASAMTAGGIVQVFRLPIISLSALGQTRNNFRVIAHNLPSSASVDGLLGLDFFRGQILTLDFPKGEITLNPGQTP